MVHQTLSRLKHRPQVCQEVRSTRRCSPSSSTTKLSIASLLGILYRGRKFCCSSTVSVFGCSVPWLDVRVAVVQVGYRQHCAKHEHECCRHRQREQVEACTTSTTETRMLVPMRRGDGTTTGAMQQATRAVTRCRARLQIPAWGHCYAGRRACTAAFTGSFTTTHKLHDKPSTHQHTRTGWKPHGASVVGHGVPQMLRCGVLTSARSSRRREDFRPSSTVGPMRRPMSHSVGGRFLEGVLRPAPRLRDCIREESLYESIVTETLACWCQCVRHQTRSG
jgi:hypothetical protein